MSKPIVAIDGRMVVPHPHGIGRYVKNLAVGLRDLAEIKSLPYEPVFIVDRRFPGLIPQSFVSVPAQSAFLEFAEITELPRILKSLGASLYHSPSFSSLAYSPCPWIATLHDLNHLHYGSFSKRVYYQTLLKRFAARAKVLMTVSEFAKLELAQWLNKSPEGIEVVVNALDSSFSGALQPISDSQKEDFSRLVDKKGWGDFRSGEYFLCLSNAKSHKNLPFLVEAYLEAGKRSNLPPLLFSADRGELDLKIPANKSVIFTSKLDDKEAKTLLKHARAAFFPSLYEGFGLPPLEAIMNAVPVCVSDIPPHREGIQDFSSPHVKWLDPRSKDGWVKAILAWNEMPEPSALKENALFLEQRRKAAERYSVGRLASHMDQIYRRVLRVEA